MDPINLADIVKLDPRSVWNHEAHSFTPWLAENIERLGDALGLELEIREREANVGGFSLDLLAHELGRNTNVIIENQLEITDHDHLGKLITYAGGYDAGIAIWVSTEVREEHRQAIDWLNQRTDSDTEFFGVAIELIRIGDSPPALQFRVVAFPNEWRKSNKKPEPTSEKSEKYRSYFQSLIDDLRETHKFTSAKKGQPQNWYTFASGSKQFVYSHSFAAGGRVRVEIYIDSGDGDENQAFFDRLTEEREQIEDEIDAELEWERLENRRACRVALYRDGSIEAPQADLQEIHEWAVKNLLKFRGTFGRYV